MATVLAFIYGVVPTYAVAIILLTILIMALLTPLTIKSTKSMLAMQALQPEMQKLRQKYKGAENREQLNQEMMRLYREHGVSPTGGCLPMFLQMPALIVLYDVIRGLANTIGKGTKFPTTAVLPLTIAKQNAVTPHHGTVTWAKRSAGNNLVYVGPHHGGSFHALACTPHVGTVCAVPRYIPSSSTMFHHLVNTPGVMKSFGLNLASKPLTHHANWWDYIPYLVLVAVAVGAAVLPDEPDDQAEQGGGPGEPADADHAEGHAADLRLHLLHHPRGRGPVHDRVVRRSGS